MNEIATIKNLILEIRGQKVMLDSDLAMLYEVETRALNQAVKRNRRKNKKTQEKARTYTGKPCGND